jgi:2,4-dienoyl-CoA reductase-like NADH-dependent reductase (Old Yellow Enzyme family)
MTRLFDPLAIRDITFANRVFVSPMCQYSSTDGYASDWHFVHLGSRAVGAAGLACIMQRSDRYGAQNVAFA